MSVERSIHQVYLGKLPPREAKWCDEMRRMNADWKYHFWNEDRCERYDSDSIVAWLRQNREPIAFIVDRLRVLILRDFGGVYLDCDCQPIRPLSTLKCWEGADFVAGMRNPDRQHVSLQAPGIGFVDNTVLGSAKEGRMIRRLVDLFSASGRKQNGMSTGREILRNADEGTRLLNHRYFYAMQEYPETIVLHDAHSLGSWTDKTKVRAESPILV